MRVKLGQTDAQTAQRPPILVVSEAEAQEMCDDPRCDKVKLNQALLRCSFMEGWEVHGGAETLRQVGLVDWAERAEAEAAKTSERQEPGQDTPPPARTQTPLTASQEAIAKLRTSQKSIVHSPEATPRQLMLEALGPVQQFGDHLV